MPSFLDFGKPIAELEGKIEKLRHLLESGVFNIADEVTRMIEPARINDFDAQASLAKVLERISST